MKAVQPHAERDDGGANGPQSRPSEVVVEEPPAGPSAQHHQGGESQAVESLDRPWRGDSVAFCCWRLLSRLLFLLWRRGCWLDGGRVVFPVGLGRAGRGVLVLRR